MQAAAVIGVEEQSKRVAAPGGEGEVTVRRLRAALLSKPLGPEAVRIRENKARDIKAGGLAVVADNILPDGRGSFVCLLLRYEAR